MPRASKLNPTNDQQAAGVADQVIEGPSPSRRDVSRIMMAVVVTHNRLQLLQQCIAAIRSQRHPPSAILVVDNGSADGTPAWLSAQDDLLVVTQPNLGCAGGFERGIAEALSRGADWVWCMDDDTVPEVGCLEEFDRAICLAPLTGCFASLVVWTDGTTHRMNAVSPNLEGADVSLIDAGLLPINRASFVSICVSAPAVVECGLPLGDMFLWFDDVEFTARISRKYPAYLVTKSRALHKTQSNAGVPTFTQATKTNYRRMAMGYRNHVVYKRQTGMSRIPLFLFTAKSAVKILLLYLRFGPDWARIPWISRGLLCRQQPKRVERCAPYSR
jgi:GT2 family glycosyltransferase